MNLIIAYTSLETIELTLSFPTDLSWHKGIKNTGKDAEVYVPQSGPNGLIKVEVSRDQKSVL